MFKNIGKKIKSLAAFLCALGIFASIVGAAVMCFGDQGIAGIGLAALTLVGGIIVSWLSSIGMYAFGELVDSTSAQVKQNDEIIRLLNNNE